MQKSGGISVGGNFQGQGGELSLDISSIKGNRNGDIEYGDTMTEIKMGSKEKPYPILLQFMNISDALEPEFWTSRPEEACTLDSINHFSTKQRNLAKARAEYADYKGINQLIGNSA